MRILRTLIGAAVEGDGVDAGAQKSAAVSALWEGVLINLPGNPG